MMKPIRSSRFVALALVALAVAPAARALDPGPRVHVLKDGETLWSVALAYRTSVSAVKAVNTFEDADPEKLPAGTEVRVPEPHAMVAPSAEANPSAAPAAKARAGDDRDDDGQVAPAEMPDGAGEADLEEAGAKIRARLKSGKETHKAGSGRFVWPVPGEVLSRFGQRRRRAHTGIDIKGDRGSPIVAAADGRAIFSGRVRGYGNVVVLEHSDGWFTVYGHNQKNLVSASEGDGPMVRRGETIALLGSTGNASTPHVHFEVRHHGNPVDPLKHLGRSIPLDLVSAED